MKTKKRGQRALTGAIGAYQAARAGRPSGCRYWPSCSEYAKEAIELHGSVRGSWMGFRRLTRCHPWGSSGVDPVPMPAGTARGHR
jgi:uncharacterized protein